MLQTGGKASVCWNRPPAAAARAAALPLGRCLRGGRRGAGRGQPASTASRPAIGQGLPAAPHPQARKACRRRSGAAALTKATGEVLGNVKIDGHELGAVEAPGVCQAGRPGSCEVNRGRVEGAGGLQRREWSARGREGVF